MNMNNFKRRLLISIPIAVLAILLISVSVLAVISGDVYNFTADPSVTSMSLSWSLATGSTSTVVRYLTTGFPTSSIGADGSVLVYSGALNSYIQTDLTPSAPSGALVAGTTYYYSAWGFDGANYSTNKATIAGTTKGTTAEGDDLPTPTLPSNMNQVSKSTDWFTNLQPFTGIIGAFADDWGMPRDNSMLAFSALAMVAIGVVIYIKTRNFFIAYAVILALDVLSIGMHVMFGWSLYILIALGLGVWALEHNFQ